MAIGGKAEESGRDRVAIKNAIVTMIELAVKVISKRLTFHLFFSSDFSWEFSEKPIYRTDSNTHLGVYFFGGVPK